MAYMNLETYNIFNFISNNVDKDKFVEIDELIAPIISLLNKKGYKTKFCCSGHPFVDYILDESGTGENWNAEWNENRAEHFQIDPYLNSYIMFEPGIIIHSCPDNSELEMEMKHNEKDLTFSINHYYDLEYRTVTYIEMYKLIVDTMNEWMEWAESLPEYNPMISLAMFAKYINHKFENFSVETFIDALEHLKENNNEES